MDCQKRVCARDVCVCVWVCVCVCVCVCVYVCMRFSKLVCVGGTQKCHKDKGLCLEKWEPLINDALQ